MKNPYLILLLGIVTSLSGVIASFISAAKYGYIFAAIIVFDVIALGCLVYLFRLGSGWRLVALLLGIFVIYTLADVILRFALGMRVLDMMK